MRLLSMLAFAVGCGGSAGAAPNAADPPPAAAAVGREQVRKDDGHDEANLAPAGSDGAVKPSEPVEPSAHRWGHADLDPDNDEVLGPPAPVPECEQRLQVAGVHFKPARIGVGRKRDGVYTCGARQVVRYRRGPGEIAYGRAPLLTCSMALALADFERVLQQEAMHTMQSRVERIDHLGTYNCRKMVAYDLISEHSFANGIDLAEFHFENGETISVLEHFRPDEESPTDPKTRFLRGLANRLYDEEVFSVVVTPFFDHLHRNHIHVDLARYRVDGSRP